MMTTLDNDAETRCKSREEYAKMLQATTKDVCETIPAVLYGRIIGPSGTSLATLTIKIPTHTLKWLENYAERLKSDVEAVTFNMLMHCIDKARETEK